MKPPRPQIHIIDVDDPILVYRNLTCRCGITIRSAIPKFMEARDLNESAKPSSWPNLLGICLKCDGLIPLTEEGKRTYSYGLIEAEEAIERGMIREEEMSAA